MSSDQDRDELAKQIRELDLDYMKGWINEDDYKARIAELKSQLAKAGGGEQGIPSISITEEQEQTSATTGMASAKREGTVDPVTAIRRTIQAMRRLPIERIAQESGVDAINATKIISDLLDGRELSGRIDRDSGDFILGTGTGPAPKTIAACPYCKSELERIAVRGETINCPVCNESFIVS
ncbi:hypothetical protein EU538_00100 [Candidatus Thorarchaeota archaeon]|jgi:hypothetical protein|nr:MAG: hypothetical protein EU538_00100 [Candidatus Thorarchaeota archaeon]